MFNNLLSKNIKPDISKIESIQETKISGDLKLELTKLFYEEEKGFVNVSDCTTIIKTDKNYVFFPNQYYYLAVICKDYAEALCEYCDFFDKKIRNSNELNFIVLNQDFKNIKYTELFENEDDLKKFTRFLIDENYRPGKKFINGKEDKSFRGTKDIFGSCILKMLPLPDASSGYFGNIVYYLSKRKNLFQKLEKFYAELNVISSVVDLNCNLKPIQTIYYGVPGCGKSFSIENELRKLGITKTMEAVCTKRVVFHPEYTNADFVGQILPQSINDGEKVSYPFVAGPFTQILAKAYTHRNTPYALIIEEINRGNAAAIFGELFQLLDRLDKDEVEMSNDVSYQKNWSSYPITNDNINKEIFAAYDKYKDDKNEKGESSFEPFIAIENFKKYKLNIGIRLPPNLSILATMNTNDQNVFKLDNAFKRRWDLQLVSNEFGDENGKLSKEEESQRDAKIEGFSFTWNEFRMAINKVISSPDNSFDSSSFSDKQLGCWFVKAENEKIKKEVFVHKVLEYLWDDVFTFEKTLVFEKNYQTFAELANSVLKGKTTDIFSESFLHILSAQKTKNNETNSATEKSQSETSENQQNQDL